MSFVKKAIKKVFNVVKKVVKSKVFMIIAIAALIFFTAGVAAGGFAAFAGVNGIGSFFVAVGQTMATGAAAMASGVGLTGVSSSLAAHGGAAATAAGLAGAPGVIAAGASSTLIGASGAVASAAPGSITAAGLGEAAIAGTTVGSAAVPLASPIAAGVTSGVGTTAGITGTGVAVAAGESGVGTVIGDLMGKKVLGDVSLGQVVTNGVVAGVANVIKSKQDRREFPNGYVAGGLARGGGSEAPPPYTFTFGEAVGSDPGNLQAQQAAEDPTVAAQLAQEIGGPVETTPAQQPGGIAGIIENRGPVNIPDQTQGGLVRATAPRQVAQDPRQQVVGISGSPFQDRPRDIRSLVGV